MTIKSVIQSFNQRGDLMRFSLLILFLIVATLQTRGFAADDNPPNIILCMADDQGWADVGYYGYSQVKTPVLDEMAASGLRFDRFYAAAPVCSPTRGSVMTGRHPNRFGCFSWGYSLRPQEFTIAEALKEAGYTTGHFGKWHLGSVRADSPVCPGNSGFDYWLSTPNFYENDAVMSLMGIATPMRGESSKIAMDFAIEFIKDAVKKDKPFLAVVWFGSPHSPHIASDEIKALYPDATKAQQNFLGEITGIDQSMGDLRTALKNLGIADNTLLWYTSDNGVLPQGHNGGLRGRKGNLYEAGIRVPAIIEWPNTVKQPRVTEAVCNTVDIYPTVLDIIGHKVDDQPILDGESLKPLIEGADWKRDKPLGFWVYPQRGISTPSNKWMAQLLVEQKAGKKIPAEEADPTPYKNMNFPRETPGHAVLLDGDLKLHKIPAKKGTEFEYELYNLATDRAEANNIADQHPEKVAAMKTQLDAWQKSVVGSLNGEDY